MSTFASRLKTAMEGADMKAIDLHRETGISKATISEYLSGNYEPKQRNIYKLAKALHIQPNVLMGMESDSTPINPPAPPSTDSEYIEKYKALNAAHKDAVNNQIDYFTGIEQDDEEQEGGSA